jgi:hypothetical protein
VDVLLSQTFPLVVALVFGRGKPIPSVSVRGWRVVPPAAPPRPIQVDMSTLPARRAIKRDQAVRRIARKARVALPWLEDADAPAVKAWAQLELLAQRAYDSLREGGLLNEKGEARSLLDVFQRLRKTALAFEKELGMTVKSRAEIRSGSRSLPVDGTYERIERVHKDRHKDDAAEEA